MEQKIIQILVEIRNSANGWTMTEDQFEGAYILASELLGISTQELETMLTEAERDGYYDY